ncbi:MAG: CDP-diacylglycerol--glycerol-3-phosphate 3-phosphatidyltransferase [Clostridia bacterium]|nr:CDP-diacylglycerol--glycerol-3-phosphate 3-phosphatidyltransferase [Clostridia bacterium]
MNLPNKLSLTRMALIPLMVALMYPNNTFFNLLSAAVFGAAAFTDYLDGHIARKEGIVTDFGKFIDPVADKLLVLSAMVMLVNQGLMPAWIVVLILARELCVDGLRMVASGKGMVIAAGKLGKIKTVTQIILVLWLMILRLPVAGNFFSAVLALVVVAMTLWSGAEYFINNLHIIRNAK